LQSHSLFLNIFEETYRELVSLISTFNQLSIVYKPQENLEIDNDESNLLSINNSELEDNLLLINSDNSSNFNFDSVLSKTQIDIYRQIYMKQPFEDEKDDTLNSIKLVKKQLDNQEEEAYLHRLSTNKCCTNNCLTKINHNNGLIKYKQIRNYTKAELDVFLLAMIE
ncbi:7621_t:CDS:1, partial [Racocetra persica]